MGTTGLKQKSNMLKGCNCSQITLLLCYIVSISCIFKGNLNTPKQSPCKYFKTTNNLA